MSEDAIHPSPEDIPDVEDISIQLRTPCNVRSYPIKELIRIVDDPDFNITKKVVIASSGWLTNANTSDNMLQGIGKAYHCRGDTNFLVRERELQKYFNCFHFKIRSHNRELMWEAIYKRSTPGLR